MQEECMKQFITIYFQCFSRSVYTKLCYVQSLNTLPRSGITWTFGSWMMSRFPQRRLYQWGLVRTLCILYSMPAVLFSQLANTCQWPSSYAIFRFTEILRDVFTDRCVHVSHIFFSTIVLDRSSSDYWSSGVLVVLVLYCPPPKNK